MKHCFGSAVHGSDGRSYIKVESVVSGNIGSKNINVHYCFQKGIHQEWSLLTRNVGEDESGGQDQRESFCSYCGKYLSMWGLFIDLFACSFMLMGGGNEIESLAGTEKLKVEKSSESRLRNYLGEQ